MSRGEAKGSVGESSQSDGLPAQVKWLYAFQGCNAMNFTIALGAPLVLTARYIGASETIVGVLTALGPLMVVLQLFATGPIHRLGYRRVMLLGWGARAFMLLFIVPLPFLVGVVREELLVALLVVPLFLFNAIRGFASAAWLPWLSSILPVRQRGLYLGTEQRVMNLSAFVTLIACGLFLGTEPDRWQYGAMFILAWFAGMMSVYFLRLAPDARPAHDGDAGGTRNGQFWAGVQRTWKNRRFRRVIVYTAVYTFAVSAQPVFLVLLVKEGLNVAEGVVLKLQSCSMFGVFLTAVFWGRLSDVVGSKPLMRLSNLALLSIFLFWAIAALGLFQPGLLLMGTFFFLGGIFTAAHAIGQIRLVLGSCPEGQETSGMVVYQVLVAAAGGTAPILFGFALERMRAEDPGPFPFALAFALMVALLVVSQYLLGRVRESGAHPTHRVVAQMLYDYPVKVLSGLATGGPGKRRSRGD